MVLLYWAAIGLIAGMLAHAVLRARGEQGYNAVGEAMLGVLGALVPAMTIGIVTGWRYIDLTSGAVAAIGAAVVLGVAVWQTLASSPARSAHPPSVD
jgi:uncharacterized membrane protein YeaQ/YmgE (transglycosylase-associated protein family)